MFYRGLSDVATDLEIKRPTWIHFNVITAGDRNKVANADYRDAGWNTDGNSIGSSIVFQYEYPVSVTQAVFYFMDPANTKTNAIYRIDCSADGVTWEAVSEQFQPAQSINSISFIDVGARTFWRAVIVASAAADGKDTSGAWFSELELYGPKKVAESILTAQPGFVPQPSIMDMKIGGVPVVVAGGGLLAVLIFLKLFR